MSSDALPSSERWIRPRLSRGTSLVSTPMRMCTTAVSSPLSHVRGASMIARSPVRARTHQCGRVTGRVMKKKVLMLLVVMLLVVMLLVVMLLVVMLRTMPLVSLAFLRERKLALRLELKPGLRLVVRRMVK